MCSANSHRQNGISVPGLKRRLGYSSLSLSLSLFIWFSLFPSFLAISLRVRTEHAMSFSPTLLAVFFHSLPLTHMRAFHEHCKEKEGKCKETDKRFAAGKTYTMGGKRKGRDWQLQGAKGRTNGGDTTRESAERSLARSTLEPSLYVVVVVVVEKTFTS